MQKKIDVSIIIVNYRVEKELLECVQSIKESKPKASFEIIVVDNDEVKTLEKNLKKKFPDLNYIPNPENSGWGGGVNVGVEQAKGNYLYFLNPDTKLLNNALDVSLDFFQEKKDAGIVSSLLFDQKKVPYTLQGTRELTPFRAVIVYTAINKLLPSNPISQDFFYRHSDRSIPFQVEIAPLTASMIKHELFRKVGMFDKKYFLYFEEYDLGKRVNLLGFHNYILPDSQVLHYWESSTKQIKGRNEILEKSRMYYFEKYFGKVKAKIVEAILRRNLSMLVVE